MQLPDFLSVDDGGFIHMTDHRIGLHHVIRNYNDGYSPEMLVLEYPTLPLSLIHKVIAFYLDNREEVDAYIARHNAEMAKLAAANPANPSLAELRKRFEAIQRQEQQRVHTSPRAPSAQP
jgi:uncharacterized protein (DUF433 family)